MNKTYLIRLGENELGQIIDGLKIRESSWRTTAKYLGSESTSEDSIAIEECSNEHEASRIADFYSAIIRNLERQRDEQRR